MISKIKSAPRSLLYKYEAVSWFCPSHNWNKVIDNVRKRQSPQVTRISKSASSPNIHKYNVILIVGFIYSSNLTNTAYYSSSNKNSFVAFCFNGK